ncbi:MAG: ComEC/Rec2 family competence protein, partial [Burkholderiaceae bacterium]
MRSAMIGFVAGAGWLQMQAELPGMTLMFLLAGAAAVSGTLIGFAQDSQRRMVLLFVAGSLSGFVWAAGFAHYRLADELPRELEGQDITLVGTIDGLPHPFEHGVRFNLVVEGVVDKANPDVKLPSRIALSWYSGFASDNGEPAASLRPGERWQLTVRLRRPHGNANPYGFDYESWLLEQRLRATGYVRPDADAAHKNLRIDSFVPGAKNFLERLRYRLREKILSALSGKEYAGVVVALVVGDQRGIAQSDWEIFNRSGIGHLIS